jgi:D-xylose transport system substrate-binding protein
MIEANRSVASALLTPEWVTRRNINSTVIADGFVQKSDLCKGRYLSACTAVGIQSAAG